MELNNIKKTIIIKFSELSLKGGNKKEFVSVLRRNLKKKFDDLKIDATIEGGRDTFNIYSENDLDRVPEALKTVVGISVFNYAYECDADKNTIETIIKEQLKEFPEGTTFRVSAKIVQNEMFESKEKMISWLAWLGTNELGFKVDLSNHEVDINVRIENEKATLILGTKERGIAGLPAGANGKALTLLSGGIDSPVAAFKTITRGINTSFLTFLTPRTSEAQTISKIKQLAEKVNEYNGINGKMFLVNFERVQEKIMLLDDSSYRITLLRRYFMRFAQLISKKYKYKFVITGDSMGQVASQTPESMTQIDNATDQLIVRPLVSSSKNEIIRIAEEIGTYEISILPGDDMCTTFTPKNPIIFPKKEMVAELEAQLEGMDDLLWSVLKEDTRIIELGEKNEE